MTRRSHRAGVVAAFLAVLLVAASAHGERAARRRASLGYVRGQGAEKCDDQEALRGLVANRLGYDPFDAEADARVDTSLRVDSRGLSAEVSFKDERGDVRGQRTLTSGEGDCRELLSAVAVTVSILLDPRAFARPAPAPPASADLTAAAGGGLASTSGAALELHGEDPPHDIALSRRGENVEPIHLRVGAGAVGSAGGSPAPAAGLEILVGLERGRWSLDVEGRADFPASATRADGTGVRSSLVLGSLVPCRRIAVFAVCALGSAGVLYGQGVNVGLPDRARAFYGAVGARGALEVPLGPGFAVRAHLDVTAPIARITLRDFGREVWTTEPVALAFGGGAVGRFR